LDLDVNEVNFLGVENILSNFLDNKVFDDFYAEKNFIFKRKDIIDSFWVIFMVHEQENMYDCRVKPKFFESNVKSFQVDICNLVAISEVLFYCRMEWIDWASEGSRQKPSKFEDEFSLTW
jgi:hypothetical protein